MVLGLFESIIFRIWDVCLNRPLYLDLQEVILVTSRHASKLSVLFIIESSEEVYSAKNSSMSPQSEYSLDHDWSHHIWDMFARLLYFVTLTCFHLLSFSYIINEEGTNPWPEGSFYFLSDSFFTSTERKIWQGNFCLKTDDATSFVSRALADPNSGISTSPRFMSTRIILSAPVKPLRLL